MVDEHKHKFYTYYYMSLHVCTALVPGEIQSLKRSIDKKQASVTLNWDPPLNFQRPGEVTNYQIRFKPIKELFMMYQICFKPTKRASNYIEKTVDVSVNSTIFTRNSGLKASTEYVFEVRARNAESTGEWTRVKAYVG